LVVKNDLKGLAGVMADREKWTKVSGDRFRGRAEFAKKAAEEKKQRLHFIAATVVPPGRCLPAKLPL
jgi:hypothetical protein